MKVWKDRDGKKVSSKEFISRFKEGINNITPTQRLNNELRATFISFIGSLIGAISLIIFMDKFPNRWLVYGLILVFVGSAYSSFIKLLVTRQQLRFFKNTENSSLNISDILSNIEEMKGGKI